MRNKRQMALGAVLGIVCTLIIQLLITNFLEPGVRPVMHNLRFVNYKISPFSLEIQLPGTTKVTEDYIYGDEVLYSCFLQDSSQQFWGYMQIWDIPDLNEFLASCKSQSEWNFITYDIQEIVYDIYKGFKISWRAEFHQGQTVLAEECFLQNHGNSMVLRVTLITDQGEFPEELAKTIISSLRWPQE